jgi:hypothetical protein
VDGLGLETEAEEGRSRIQDDRVGTVIGDPIAAAELLRRITADADS